MRLLITTDTVGGVWTFTGELTAGLLAEGHEVMLVSLGRLPNGAQTAQAEKLAAEHPEQFRWIPTELPLEWMQANGSSYTAAEPLLLRLIDQYRPELVHSNQMCFGALPRAIPCVVTVHSEVRSWFQACRGGLPESSAWFTQYERLVREGLAGADAVTAPTQWMLDSAERSYGPFHAAEVIPNGRSLPPPAQPVQRKLQAVTAGRLWDEGKDVRMLAGVRSSVPLLVAGEVASVDGARFEAPPGLDLLGPLGEDELLELFRASALYIVTSRYEPFGLAAVEAALCGCAIVANDIPSLREVWGDAAMYFRGAEELSELLDRLAAEPALIAELAGRASRRAHESYSRERMTARYRSLYERLLSRHSREAAVRHVA